MAFPFGQPCNEFITCFSWILNLQILFMKFYASFWKGSKVSFSVMRNSYSVIFEPNKKLLPGKGGFFSESVIRFSNLQISRKIYSKTILALKFIYLRMLLAGNLNFKLRIVFWNIFILDVWRFKKRIALSEKTQLYPNVV